MSADEPWIIHRLGRARVSLPPDIQLQSAAFMVRGVQIWETEAPPGSVTADDLDGVVQTRARRLLDGQAWKRTVLRPFVLGARARGFVVEERGRTQAAEAVAATDGAVLRLEHLRPGATAAALVAPMRAVIASYERWTDAQRVASPHRAGFFLQRGVVALPFDHHEGEAVGAHWRGPACDVTLMVDVADEPSAAQRAVETVIGIEARTVRFRWRSRARRRNDLQVEVCLEGAADRAGVLEPVWRRVLGELSVTGLPRPDG